MPYTIFRKIYRIASINISRGLIGETSVAFDRRCGVLCEEVFTPSFSLAHAGIVVSHIALWPRNLTISLPNAMRFPLQPFRS